MALSKQERKQQVVELGSLAGLVRLAEAAADRAEARLVKAQVEAQSTAEFAEGLRAQAVEQRATAVAAAQAKHSK